MSNYFQEFFDESKTLICPIFYRQKDRGRPTVPHFSDMRYENAPDMNPSTHKASKPACKVTLVIFVQKVKFP